MILLTIISHNTKHWSSVFMTSGIYRWKCPNIQRYINIMKFWWDWWMPFYGLFISYHTLQELQSYLSKTTISVISFPLEPMGGLFRDFSLKKSTNITSISVSILKIISTGWERLIRSHSSARFCFELSGNLN